MKCTVIIPAAGSGSRFGAETPKQFLPLRGRPLISWAVERFIGEPDVIRIVIPTLEAFRPTLEELCEAHLWKKVELLTGGATRYESVARGLDAAGSDAEIVAVHDAVRPFFARATFQRLLALASEIGAAIPAVPLRETVHVVADGVLAETLERDSLRAAQTPQCFRYDVLREAFARSRADSFVPTDEAGLVAELGFPVAVVEGDHMNVKVTTPDDLRWLEANYEHWSDA
jgi:2-C-methyl-D-erythritol 4-phosphate cytidylyltransferase